MTAVSGLRVGIDAVQQGDHVSLFIGYMFCHLLVYGSFFINQLSGKRLWCWCIVYILILVF